MPTVSRSALQQAVKSPFHGHPTSVAVRAAKAGAWFLSRSPPDAGVRVERLNVLSASLPGLRDRLGHGGVGPPDCGRSWPMAQGHPPGVAELWRLLCLCGCDRARLPSALCRRWLRMDGRALGPVGRGLNRTVDRPGKRRAICADGFDGGFIPGEVIVSALELVITPMREIARSLCHSSSAVAVISRWREADRSDLVQTPSFRETATQPTSPDAPGP